MIIVSADIATKIQIFVSTEATRYYLNGFYVEPHHEKGTLVVATDGHRMGIFHDENGFCDEPGVVKLSKDFLKAAKDKAFPTLSRYVVVEPGAAGKGVARMVVAQNDPAELGKPEFAPGGEYCLAVQGAALIDGTFPDWRRVTPSDARYPVCGSFNASYVAAFGSICEGKTQSIQMFGCNQPDENGVVAAADGPVVVRVPSTPHFMGILMPMRATYGADDAMPSWLNPPAPAAEEPEEDRVLEAA